MPLTVVPIGRVCGTGIGMACTQVTVETARRGGEVDDRRGEAVPREIGLVSREHEERLAERVVREREFEPRRAIVGQVVLVERDDGAPRPVVQQHVVREDGDRSRVEFVAEVVDEPADGGSRRP